MRPPLIVALEYACKEMRGFRQRLAALTRFVDSGSKLPGAPGTLQQVAQVERDRLVGLEGEVRFEGYTMEELAARMEQLVREFDQMSERARREKSLPDALLTAELEMRIMLQLDI